MTPHLHTEDVAWIGSVLEQQQRQGREPHAGLTALQQLHLKIIFCIEKQYSLMPVVGMRLLRTSCAVGT